MIKRITVSNLQEVTDQTRREAKASGYEFIVISGAATVGGAMIEGQYGDVVLDLTNDNAIGTRAAGSEEAAIAALTAKRV